MCCNKRTTVGSYTLCLTDGVRGWERGREREREREGGRERERKSARVHSSDGETGRKGSWDCTDQNSRHEDISRMM